MLLKASGCSAAIDLEAGGRLSSLRIDGVELLVTEGRDVFHWGNFAMAPWVGRLRDGRLTHGGTTYELPQNAPPHALHGLVSAIPWRHVGPGVVAVDLPRPWPWRGRVTHSLNLTPGRLDFRLELEAAEVMPAAVGWHPWFRTDLVSAGEGSVGPIELDVRPGEMYENGPDGLPTGSLVAPVPKPWDYCFTALEAPPVVRWPGFLELIVESSCSDWVIYDQEPQGVCVEPWTAPPNSLNMPAPTIVMPGSPLVATMSWRWRRLSG